jgi:hypothetical protein
MYARGQVSVDECPGCGRPALWWLKTGLIQIDCLNDCGVALDAAHTVPLAASRDRDAIAPVEVVVVLFEQAISDTAVTYGLPDLREAASLVADAWAAVLREEGRSPRSIELATAAVRGIGDRMHRRQN